MPRTTRNRISVLFTSIGRRVELVRAFRAAYTALGITGKLVGVDADPLAPALQIADKAYMTPLVESADYVSTLEAICRREEIDLIFPLIDPDITVLARARLVLEATGARVAVVSGAAAAVSADKWQTTQLFQELGLATPKSWLPLQMGDAEISYPLFIKPRFGSASKHAFRVDNPRQLAFFLEYVPHPIIQEYVEGPEITSDVLCDLDGTLLGVVSRRRIEVRAGEVVKGVTVHLQCVIDACARIARDLPAIGPITVQCLMKGDVPYFTEINARLGGGVPLGIAAGLNVPLLLLGRYAGLPVEVPPLGVYQSDLHLTRFDDSFLLTKNEHEQMASRHVEMVRSSLI